MTPVRRHESRGCGARTAQSLLFIFFALVVFVLAVAWFFHRALVTPYKGYEGESARVEVPRGWNSGRILDRLRAEGILRDEFVPTLYLKALRRGESLKAGLYEFRGERSPIEVIDQLIEGRILLESITIREGLDRFAVGALMSKAGHGTLEQWNALTADPSRIEDLAPAATSLEGYLFPETYVVAPNSDASTVVQLMVDGFRRAFVEEIAYIRTGLDVHETVTLASIVETEARLDDERPLIAGVYVNRLKRGMLLQADPTVVYAMKLEGIWNGNIRKRDLDIDSPYNTYRIAGLPPGPIANPGAASLRAAARPADTDALYFVSRNDGSHVFSRTLAEHNRNVTEFQRRYWREKRTRDRAAEEEPVPPTGIRR